MMTAKIKTTVLVYAVVLIAGVADAAAVPIIASFSSQGGTPQSKADDRDLIYMVEQADEITFSITTDKACEHVWSARQGSNVLASQTKQGVNLSSFTWRIPSEKANWDIEVEVSGPKRLMGPTKKAQKKWSLTTSHLVTVAPGQSIQNAIDSVPVEGGIVELAAGTWNVTTPITIRKSNTTLRGAGADKTHLIYPTPDQGGVIMTVHLGLTPQTTLKNIVLLDFHMNGNRIMRDKNQEHAALLLKNVAHSLIQGVHIEAGGYDVLRLAYSEYITVKDSTFNTGGKPIKIKRSSDCTIANCTVYDATCPIDFNTGASAVYPGITDMSFRNVVENCEISGSTGYGIHCYTGSHYTIIRNCHIHHCTAAGITTIQSHHDLYENNIIHDIGPTSAGIDIHRSSYFVIARNNIVYNVRAHTTKANDRVGAGIRVANTTTLSGRDIVVESNTIYNCAEGIHVKNARDVHVRNNILVGNRDYGITSSGGLTNVEISYNNAWNSGQANYHNISAGQGGISIEPLLVNPSAGDFHLRSKAGRWDPDSKTWVKDGVHSPCIDAGAPQADFSKEPAPNGGRINVGAYGNTNQASKTVVPVEVKGRHVFYNNSAFDGGDAAANANDDGGIATNKTALLPGGTATFANYTSYSRGINGIMVDIANLPGTPTAADFVFKVGNDNNPTAWAAGPAPTSVSVRSGAGIGGSDRITIIWADNAIEKQWLQVTVKATTATGLGSDDVFYFGNAVGETGNSPTEATVKPTDEIGARNNPHTLGGLEGPAGIDDIYDFNRDRKVGPTDEIIARSNGTNSITALKLITVP